jgi:hypothetical protein
MSADRTTPAQDRANFRLMLEVVAATRDESSGAQATWVVAVESKMNLVGVVSLKDYVRSVMVMNEKLVRAERKQMHVTTLQQMFKESCDMLFGPVGWVEGPTGWVEQNVEADVVGSAGTKKVD